MVDELRRRIHSIQRQVGRLGALTKQRARPRPDRSARLRLEVEPCDLAEIVRDVASRFEDTLRTEGRSLSIAAPVAVVGRWDRTRLEQLLSNLVVNAVKHGGRGGVTISAAPHGASAVVTVSDTGPGIPPAQQALVFDAFAQGDRGGAGGLGLGLFIARSIANAHGGVIALESDAGRGTTFRVELPLGEAKPGSRPRPARTGGRGREDSERVAVAEAPPSGRSPERAPAGPARQNPHDAVGPPEGLRGEDVSRKPRDPRDRPKAQHHREHPCRHEPRRERAPALARDAEAVRDRAGRDAGHAPGALRGEYAQAGVDGDLDRARARAGAAVVAGVRIPSHVLGRREARDAEERAVGTKAAAPGVLHDEGQEDEGAEDGERRRRRGRRRRRASSRRRRR